MKSQTVRLTVILSSETIERLKAEAARRRETDSYHWTWKLLAEARAQIHLGDFAEEAERKARGANGH